jgi:phosphatidylinositol 4-kinase
MKTDFTQSIREFEVLLALCKAAPLLQTAESSQKLVKQLSLYMLEAHSQVFVPSPFFRAIEPSPIEALSYNLSAALLSLGVNHDELQEVIADMLWNYLDNCTQTTERTAQDQNSEAGNKVEIEDAIRIATVSLSIHGFLDAAASYANFWSADERLNLIQRINALISDDFLIAVETAFSTIRNSTSQNLNVKEWKRCIRHYSAIGRPLGAMLLQRSFMWVLVAGSSLLLADVDVLIGHDILELLMSSKGIASLTSSRSEEVDFDAIEALADIAADEMTLLENSADYIRLGSASQQRVAFAAKASAITGYLNCALLNEDAADADILMAWLEHALADPVQMADETLANVVLRGMALISKLSPSYASNVSRLLPRFIVQGGSSGQAISTASTCLAFVLQSLSQDATITTLYTLGNVLSSSSNAERALLGGLNGESALDISLSSGIYGGKQSNGSFISLNTHGEEETSGVYVNVVQAICGIAIGCKDPKITALAQSMLLQKIEKVSEAVDANIITEAAGLALSGGALDFRGLLKLYAKLSHDGVVQNDQVLLAAVS